MGELAPIDFDIADRSPGLETQTTGINGIEECIHEKKFQNANIVAGSIKFLCVAPKKNGDPKTYSPCAYNGGSCLLYQRVEEKFVRVINDSIHRPQVEVIRP